MNNIILAIIGINSNNYNRYLMNSISFLFILSNIHFYYGIYNIFILRNTSQILQCLIILNDFIIYFNLKFSNKCKFINEFYNENINPDLKNKIINPIFILSIFISVFLSFIFSFLTFYNYNYILVKQFTTNITLRIIIVFFSCFFTFQIKLYSLVTFFSIFYILYTFFRDLKNTIIQEQFLIHTICQQIIEIKHKYTISVNKLNIFLSSNILCNFISTYLFIFNIFNKKKTDLLTIQSSIYFIISIIIFHIVLVKIYGCIDEIKNIIDNNKYIRLFLDRKIESYKLNIQLSELNDYNQNQLNFKNYILGIENGESIDWMILNNIINQKLKSFEIFGFDIDNDSIIIKIFSLFLVLWIGKISL